MSNQVTIDTYLRNCGIAFGRSDIDDSIKTVSINDQEIARFQDTPMGTVQTELLNRISKYATGGKLPPSFVEARLPRDYRKYREYVTSNMRSLGLTEDLKGLCELESRETSSFTKSLDFVLQRACNHTISIKAQMGQIFCASSGEYEVEDTQEVLLSKIPFPSKRCVCTKNIIVLIVDEPSIRTQWSTVAMVLNRILELLPQKVEYEKLMLTVKHETKPELPFSGRGVHDRRIVKNETPEQAFENFKRTASQTLQQVQFLFGCSETDSIRLSAPSTRKQIWADITKLFDGEVGGDTFFTGLIKLLGDEGFDNPTNCAVRYSSSIRGQINNCGSKIKLRK
jgi:hypothetical protein